MNISLLIWIISIHINIIMCSDSWDDDNSLDQGELKPPMPIRHNPSDFADMEDAALMNDKKMMEKNLRQDMRSNDMQGKVPIPLMPSSSTKDSFSHQTINSGYLPPQFMLSTNTSFQVLKQNPDDMNLTSLMNLAANNKSESNISQSNMRNEQNFSSGLQGETAISKGQTHMFRSPGENTMRNEQNALESADKMQTRGQDMIRNGHAIGMSRAQDESKMQKQSPTRTSPSNTLEKDMGNCSNSVNIKDQIYSSEFYDQLDEDLQKYIDRCESLLLTLTDIENKISRIERQNKLCNEKLSAVIERIMHYIDENTKNKKPSKKSRVISMLHNMFT